MGVSTVRKIIYETCDAIWNELHMYVAQPNQHEWKRISDRFYVKTGMPNCLGAIDGKHVNIVCPQKSGSLFYNYKKTFSIVLMAVCDADYNFIFIDVGAMGSLCSQCIWKNDFKKQHTAPPDDNLPGTDKTFPNFFVGDNAFPLKRNLMRPYPGRSLPLVKQNFNKKLSAARVHIENAFVILANRWRFLHTTIHASPKNVDKIVLATVVLHNYLMLDKSSGYFEENMVDHEENGIFIPGTWRESSEKMLSSRISHANRSSVEVFALRDDLAEYLLNN